MNDHPTVDEAILRVYKVLQLPESERLRAAGAVDVLSAVETLNRHLEYQDKPDNMVLHALGWWHELFSHTCPNSAAEDAHHRRAVELLAGIYRFAPEKVPVEVATTILANVHREATVLYEILNRRNAGELEVDLDRAVRAGRFVLANTPALHLDLVNLINLGAALHFRHEAQDHFTDLDEAIELFQTALDSIAERDLQYPALLSNLGISLRSRYLLDKNLADLDKAIEFSRRAISKTPDGHLELGGRLSNLTLALLDRYECTRNLTDLDEAIRVSRAGIKATNRSHPARPGRLSDLGRALHTRYNLNGQNSDLDEAIIAHRTAISITPATPSVRRALAGRLSNLGAALSSRYDLGNQITDLNEAIELYRAAIEITPQGHADRPMYVNNLGAAMISMYRRSGRPGDLDEAILHFRNSVHAKGDREPNPAFLLNLDTALWERFELGGELADFEESIQVMINATNVLSTDDPARVGILTTIAERFWDRYKRVGRVSDIEGAVHFYRLAVAKISDDEENPERPWVFFNLGAMLRARYLASGKLRDLNESIRCHRTALELAPDDHKERPSFISRLASTLATRYEFCDAVSDLDEAVTLHRSAIELAPKDHGDRPWFLAGLSKSLLMRHAREGRLSDLDDSVELSRAAVELTPKGDRDLPLHLSNLGQALCARYGLYGRQADIEEAIEVGRNAIESLPDGDLERPGALSNLAASLMARYASRGQLDDLNMVIDLQRSAVSLTPQSNPELPRYLSNLGAGIFLRFEHCGAVSELDEAIDLLRSAIGDTNEGGLENAERISSLGYMLGARYHQLGNLADLEAAIQLQRTACALAPPHAVRRASMLSKLGAALNDRYIRDNHQDDLDEAIELHRTALNSIRESQSHRSYYLSNLGAVLLNRFERAALPADLDQAIMLHRQALDATSEGDINYIRIIVALSDALLVALRVTSNIDFLDEATGVLESAIGMVPEANQERAALLLQLGMCRWESHSQRGRVADKPAAIAAFRQAAESRTAPPLLVCNAALHWGLLEDGVEAVEAFEHATTALSRIGSWNLGLDDSLNRLGSVSGFGRDAAAACLAIGDPEHALEMLEHVRAVTFGRRLKMGSELEKLAETHSDYAQQITAALSVLNSASYKLALPSYGVPPRSKFDTKSIIAGARWEAASAVEDLIEQVRQLPGWDRFLLPTRATDLLAANPEGPVIILNVAARRCDALIVASGAVTNIELRDLSEKTAAEFTTRFIQAIHSLYRGDATATERKMAEEELWRVCAWLWDSVAGPVLEHLGYTEVRTDRDYSTWPRVWWLPIGPLALLPLHAAGHHAHPEHAALIDRDRTVIDRVISSTIPTLGALMRAQSRAASSPVIHKLLAAGLVTTPACAGREVDLLPAVKAEIAAVTNSLSEVPTTILTDFMNPPTLPTKPAILASLPAHAWAHIACHAVTDPHRPTRSQLLLADHQNKPFTVLDLANLALPNPDLLYLSACTTARTSFANLDDPIHFAAAGQLAGYRHVIASLWPLVDDALPASIIYGDLAHDGHPDTWTAGGAATAVHHATHYMRESRHLGWETQLAPIHAWAPYIHGGP